MRLVAVGAVIGVVLAGTVTWLISGYLYGISSTDVVTFLAMMELTRERVIDIIQNEPLGRIYLKLPDGAALETD